MAETAEPVVPSTTPLTELLAKYPPPASMTSAEQEAAKYARIEEIAVLFTAFSDLTSIRIQGWTPGFNDGDPCTHHQDIYINGFDSYGEGDGDDDGDGDAPTRNWKSSPMHTTIDNLLSGMEGALYAAFNTNWKVKIWREDDEIRWVESEYDCGF